MCHCIRDFVFSVTLLSQVGIKVLPNFSHFPNRPWVCEVRFAVVWRNCAEFILWLVQVDVMRLSWTWELVIKLSVWCWRMF